MKGQMLTSLVAIRPRRLTLAAAVGAFAVVFALRLAFPAPSSGIAALYFIPLAILAIEYGWKGGLWAALLALILTEIGSMISDFPLPLASYVPRTAGYLVVGLLTGWMAERLRAADADIRESARHFELSEELVGTFEPEGAITHINDSWRRTLGWTEEELIGMPVWELIHPDDLDQSAADSLESVLSEAPAPFVNRNLTKDGSYRWMEWSLRRDQDTELIHMVGRDITDRRDAERAGQEARERFQRVFDDSFAGIAIVGLDGKVIQANRTMVRMLGYERLSELAGRDTQEQFVEESSLAAIQDGVGSLLAGTVDSYRGEIQLKRRGGGLTWVDLTMALIRDEDGSPLYRVTQVLDIQARKEAEEKLRHLAEHDPLSGVYNRRRFEQELELELGHGAQFARSAAILLFDVDGFKQINDSLGHAAGDAVIARLGATLRDLVRTGDVVARIGGDEFAILLRRVDAVEAQRIAAKIRAQARDAVSGSIDGRVRTGLSGGVAMIGGGDVVSADELLGQADAAMYEAKRAGGDRVVLSDAYVGA
jgi:diguanylate cyclase (GGDEF)-like protein/PAS domain S-box-containing protein